MQLIHILWFDTSHRKIQASESDAALLVCVSRHTFFLEQPCQKPIHSTHYLSPAMAR
jgi:hypothetical protein